MNLEEQIICLVQDVCFGRHPYPESKRMRRKLTELRKLTRDPNEKENISRRSRHKHRDRNGME